MSTDDLLPNEYPWPRKGDDPFKVLNGDRLIACLNFTHDQPWGGYAEGYKMLGDLGVAHVEKTGHDQDFLVYPIVFSYRHYIEPSLKLIIRAARHLLDEPGEVPETHDLLHLWNTAEPLLTRIANSAETHRDVRDCLARFNAMEPTSQAFRYPVTKSKPASAKKSKPSKKTLEASLPNDLYHLDLGQLRDVVKRLSGFLDTAGEQTLVYLDYKAEMAQEYGSGW